MNLQKISLQRISLLALFFLILAVPGAVGAVKTFHVQENDLVSITPEILDRDNDKVIYTYSPPLDNYGRWQTGYEDAGEYLLKIVAFDGTNQVTKEVLLIVDNKNQPPYLTEKKIKIKELQLLDLKQFAADPDKDPLEYVFSEPFDKNGLWMPGYNDQGTFVTMFSVRDGEFTVPMRMEVEVLNTNQPPAIISSFSDEEEIFVNENENFSFYAEAEDGDGNPVYYSWRLKYLNGRLLIGPLTDNTTNNIKTTGNIKTTDNIKKPNNINIADSTINSSSGEYFFDFNSAGEYELAVQVNSGQHKIEKKWRVVVENVNRKPNLELPPLTVKEGEAAVLKLPEKDADGDVLTYTFDEKFDANGSWQTDYEDAGTYNIKFYVSDGVEEVKERVEVTVLNIDRAPELYLPEKLEVKEGEKISFRINVSDPDRDTVKISFENAPEGAIFDAETNMFSWSPGFDYIHRRGGMLSNILNALRLEQKLLREKKILLKVKACSQDLCSAGNIPLTINNSNRAPVLEKISNMTIAEGELLQLQPNSYDPDGDIVRYYFTDPVHKRKGQWETTYEDAGEYIVNITATDGVASRTMSVMIKVLQNNRQPEVLVSDDEYELSEGEEFVLPVGVFDPDNDSLSLSVENLPAGASFRNNTLAWTPAYDFTVLKQTSGQISGNSILNEVNFLSEESKASGSKREHWISFIASDREFNVSHPVKLIVKNVNHNPKINSFVPAGSSASLVLHPGQPFNFSVDVSDVDGDNLTYAWNFEPGGEKIIGFSAVERTFITPGEKKVSVRVSDGFSEVRREWTVTVQEETSNLPKTTLALKEPEEPKFKVYVINH